MSETHAQGKLKWSLSCHSPDLPSCYPPQDYPAGQTGAVESYFGNTSGQIGKTSDKHAQVKREWSDFGEDFGACSVRRQLVKTRHFWTADEHRASMTGQMELSTAR